jgi:uncharacterized protein
MRGILCLLVVTLVTTSLGQAAQAKGTGGLELLEAAEQGDAKRVQELLSKGADTRQKRPADGRTPLMIAAVKGDVEVGSLLIRAGADVNVRDSEGWTPLMLAVANENLLGEILFKKNRSGVSRHYEIAALLIEAKADVNTKNKGSTALVIASEKPAPEIAELLLKNRADPNVRTGQMSETPLMRAAYRADESMVSLLIAYGADVNARDEEGLTALSIAYHFAPLSPQELEAVVEELEKAGAKE